MLGRDPQLDPVASPQNDISDIALTPTLVSLQRYSHNVSHSHIMFQEEQRGSQGGVVNGAALIRAMLMICGFANFERGISLNQNLIEVGNTAS